MNRSDELSIWRINRSWVLLRGIRYIKKHNHYTRRMYIDFISHKFCISHFFTHKILFTWKWIFNLFLLFTQIIIHTNLVLHIFFTQNFRYIFIVIIYYQKLKWLWLQFTLSHNLSSTQILYFTFCTHKILCTFLQLLYSTKKNGFWL